MESCLKNTEVLGTGSTWQVDGSHWDPKGLKESFVGPRGWLSQLSTYLSLDSGSGVISGCAGSRLDLWGKHFSP